MICRMRCILADCVIDILSDQQPDGADFVEDASPRSVEGRTFVTNGSGIDWRVPQGTVVVFLR